MKATQPEDPDLKVEELSRELDTRAIQQAGKKTERNFVDDRMGLESRRMILDPPTTQTLPLDQDHDSLEMWNKELAGFPTLRSEKLVYQSAGDFKNVSSSFSMAAHFKFMTVYIGSKCLHDCFLLFCRPNSF